MACLIYSDPRDDGTVTIENGYDAYVPSTARIHALMAVGILTALHATRHPFSAGALSSYPSIRGEIL